MYRLSFYLMNALILMVSAAAVSGASAQSGNNLTGAWRLNKDLSDDLAKVMEATQGERRAGGGHTPPGGVGGHGPGMHRGGRDTHGKGDEAEQQMRMWLHEPPGRLTITQTDRAITFTDGDGRSQRLATTGEKQRISIGRGTVEVRTKWDGERLVKETSLARGMKVTETYSVVSDAKRLQVMIKLEGSHLQQAVNFRRFYDAENTR
jgi:hypothetical protein